MCHCSAIAMVASLLFHCYGNGVAMVWQCSGTIATPYGTGAGCTELHRAAVAPHIFRPSIPLSRVAPLSWDIAPFHPPGSTDATIPLRSIPVECTFHSVEYATLFQWNGVEYSTGRQWNMQFSAVQGRAAGSCSIYIIFSLKNLEKSRTAGNRAEEHLTLKNDNSLVL